jgi:hypothetical protein
MIEQNNQSSSRSEGEQNNKQNKYILLSGFILIFIVAVAAGSFLFMQSKKTETVKQSPNTTQNQIKSDTSGQNLAFTANTQIQKERDDLDAFLQDSFDPETVQPGAQFQTLNIKPGGKYRMTLNYSSVGDLPMEKGILYVKLGKGLSVIPGTIKDNFKDAGEQKVADSVYDAEKGEITYGPGSFTQKDSRVQPGDRGMLVFDVQMSANAQVNDMARMYSYIHQEDGKKGKVDVVFFKVG